VPIDLHQSQLDLSNTFGAEAGRGASKNRMVDPTLGDWNGPLDQELMNYLAEANARIHAGLTVSSESWIGSVRRSADAASIMASSSIGYKDGCVSALPEILPTNFDKQRIRFTEQCILAGREYNVLGTCVENPNATDEHDRKVIMRGPKERNFIISSRAEPELEKRTLWTTFILLALGGGLMVAGTYLYLA
jgi:hypothetical protein